MRAPTVLTLLLCAAVAAACAERPVEKKEKPGPVLAPPPPPGPPPPAALPRPDWPMTAIGRVNRQRGGYCNGVLIAPDRVLTTARCLWDVRLKRWMAADDIHFVAGYHLGTHIAHSRARAFAVPAGIEMTDRGLPRRAAHDWAILTLRNPMPANGATRPVPLMRLRGLPSPAAFGTLHRAGYGRARPHALEIKRCKAVTMLNAGVLLHDCGAKLSEAGFPILANTPNGWHALGFQMISLNRGNAANRLGRSLVITDADRRRRMRLW